MPIRRPVLATLVLLASTASALAQASFPWQEPQAEVLPTGDLKASPRPFVTVKGDVVRYIDFDTGLDTHPGTSPDRPWKHHPWDKNASANARSFKDAGATFIFKRGVTYRGALTAPPVAPAPQGAASEPTRLTSDPAWGTGEAVLSGAERVTGLTRGVPATANIPEPDKVYSVRLDYAPRTLWAVAKDGKVARMNLARTPNWTWSDPDDFAAEWYVWTQPEWWTGKHKVPLPGGTGRVHRGVDPKLKAPADALDGATIWSEYGIVMGTPYPSKVRGYDPVNHFVYLEGPWGGDSENLPANTRYYLEDRPHFLDAPGEFYFDKDDKGPGGTLYVRLPDDASPDQYTLEAGRHHVLLDLKSVDRLHLTGLTFRFSNVFWNYTDRAFRHPDIQGSAIRLRGSANELLVANNVFDHLIGGVFAKAQGDNDVIRAVRVNDNSFTNLDRHVVEISNGTGWRKWTGNIGRLEHVDLLRNTVSLTGFRPVRGEHGHGIIVEFPATAHIAGNIVDTVGGSGIFVFGGKSDGSTFDAPLSRVLIHHNRVHRALKIANDWGSIETWQGGPHYVFNNLSSDPGGYWNWSFQNGKAKPSYGTARQGYAYYLDGSFKNYLFNNIAWGANNTLGDKRANTSAIQEIFSFQNNFANNTFYRFGNASRRQRGEAGRNLWLGNVIEDFSDWVWLNAGVRDRPREGNELAGHQGVQGDHFIYDTQAFGSNVFHQVPKNFGVFEPSGNVYADLASFAAALAKRGTYRADVGVLSDTPVLTAPAQRDLRPRPGSAAVDRGVRHFVPWALYATVGEWNFHRNATDPARINDDHWYMTPYYVGRDLYAQTPRHELTAANVTASDFVPGTLEDWTDSALRLNGSTQFLRAAHADLTAPYKYKFEKEERVAQGLEIASPQIGTSNFLLEFYLSLQGDTGTLLSKSDTNAGYRLELRAGKPALILRVAGTDTYTLTADTPLALNAWHHFLVEIDRKTRTATMYLDGKKLPATATGQLPTDSLENNGDLLLAGGPGNAPLAVTLDFARIARGTLADARTTIEELHAWQSAGPFLRDFTGTPPNAKRDAGAIEGR